MDTTRLMPFLSMADFPMQRSRALLEASPPPAASMTPPGSPPSPQTTQKPMQLTPPADITVVNTAQELQEAIQAGATDIEIQSHLDLTSLNRTPTEAPFDGAHPFSGYRTHLFYVKEQTRSIRGNCRNVTAAAALVATDPSVSPPPLPLKPLQCLVIVGESAFQFIRGRQWLERIYFRVKRTKVDPDFGLFTLAWEAPRSIADANNDVPTASVYMTNVTVQGEQLGRGFVAKSFQGSKLLAEDCTFADLYGSMPSFLPAFKSSAALRRCVFQDIYLTGVLVELSNGGLLKVAESTFQNIRVLDDTWVAAERDDHVLIGTIDGGVQVTDVPIRDISRTPVAESNATTAGASDAQVEVEYYVGYDVLHDENYYSWVDYDDPAAEVPVFPEEPFLLGNDTWLVQTQQVLPSRPEGLTSVPPQPLPLPPTDTRALPDAATAAASPVGASIATGDGSDSGRGVNMTGAIAGSVCFAVLLLSLAALFVARRVWPHVLPSALQPAKKRVGGAKNAFDSDSEGSEEHASAADLSVWPPTQDGIPTTVVDVAVVQDSAAITTSNEPPSLCVRSELASQKFSQKSLSWRSSRPRASANSGARVRSVGTDRSAESLPGPSDHRTLSRASSGQAPPYRTRTSSPTPPPHPRRHSEEFLAGTPPPGPSLSEQHMWDFTWATPPVDDGEDVPAWVGQTDAGGTPSSTFHQHLSVLRQNPLCRRSSAPARFEFPTQHWSTAQNTEAASVSQSGVWRVDSSAAALHLRATDVTSESGDATTLQYVPEYSVITAGESTTAAHASASCHPDGPWFPAGGRAAAAGALWTAASSTDASAHAAGASEHAQQALHALAGSSASVLPTQPDASDRDGPGGRYAPVGSADSGEGATGTTQEMVMTSDDSVANQLPACEGGSGADLLQGIDGTGLEAVSFPSRAELSPEPPQHASEDQQPRSQHTLHARQQGTWHKLHQGEGIPGALTAKGGRSNPYANWDAKASHPCEDAPGRQEQPGSYAPLSTPSVFMHLASVPMHGAAPAARDAAAGLQCTPDTSAESRADSSTSWPLYTGVDIISVHARSVAHDDAGASVADTSSSSVGLPMLQGLMEPLAPPRMPRPLHATGSRAHAASGRSSTLLIASGPLTLHSSFPACCGKGTLQSQGLSSGALLASVPQHAAILEAEETSVGDVPARASSFPRLAGHDVLKSGHDAVVGGAGEIHPHSSTSLYGGGGSAVLGAMVATVREEPQAGERTARGPASRMALFPRREDFEGLLASEAPLRRDMRMAERTLDYLSDSSVVFGRFRMLGRQHRRRGGQAIVQFATGVDDGVTYAMKFFIDTGAFHSEAALYAACGHILPSAHTPAPQEPPPGISSSTDGQATVAKFLPRVEAIVPASSAESITEAGSGRRQGVLRLPACIVMEKGESLHDWRERGEPDFFMALSVLSNVAARLADMHDAGYVHRDLKPSNVMWLPRENRWTVIDFGSAARVGERAPLSFTLTYASPEIIWAHELMREGSGSAQCEVACSVDAWSLGVMAFELLTGRPAFRMLSAGRSHVVAQLLGELRLPWEGPLPGGVDEALGGFKGPILRLLHRDPEHRGSTREFCRACRGVTAARP